MDSAAPSGTFYRPIPKARPTAPIKASGLGLAAKAPKATPTAKPYGKLWMEMAKKSRAVLDSFLRQCSGTLSASEMSLLRCK